MSNEIIRGRHDAYRTPRQAIFALVRTASGQEPDGCERSSAATTTKCTG
jgi:hypothetical protein